MLKPSGTEAKRQAFSKRKHRPMFRGIMAGMKNVRLFLACCLLLGLSQTAQAQRYYSDDGQYVADVQKIKQTPSQYHKNSVTFSIVFYVHQASDKTPPNKVSPLRSDRLICATLDGITAEGSVLPTFSNSDPDGVDVTGQDSTAVGGYELGTVRKRLETMDFTIYIVTSRWIYARQTLLTGTGSVDFGPLHYTFTANPDRLGTVESGARSYFQDISPPEIGRLWPQGIYDDAALVVTDAKKRSLYMTDGGAMTDGGNILERTVDYAAHENCFFTPTTELSDGRVVEVEKFNGPHGGGTKQIPLGYKTINYPVTLSMPMADQWTVKAEHFHLTNIALPPLTRLW